MNTAKNSKKQLKLRVAQTERDCAIIKRNLLKTRIKFLKQQSEHRYVYNDDYYRHERHKKINRIKESSEQKIIIYRALNI